MRHRRRLVRRRPKLLRRRIDRLGGTMRRVKLPVRDERRKPHLREKAAVVFVIRDQSVADAALENADHSKGDDLGSREHRRKPDPVEGLVDQHQRQHRHQKDKGQKDFFELSKAAVGADEQDQTDDDRHAVVL